MGTLFGELDHWDAIEGKELLNQDELSNPKILCSDPDSVMNDNYYIRDGTGRIIGRFDGNILRDGTGKIVAKQDQWDDRTRDRNGRILGNVGLPKGGVNDN